MAEGVFRTVTACSLTAARTVSRPDGLPVALRRAAPAHRLRRRTIMARADLILILVKASLQADDLQVRKAGCAIGRAVS